MQNWTRLVSQTVCHRQDKIFNAYCLDYHVIKKACERSYLMCGTEVLKLTLDNL